MSMLLMVQAMKAKVGNPLRKLVLVKLADQANDDGECWPSYQSIADACEMSRRTVITHIDWLEENGFLQCKHRKSNDGLSRSNVFVLTIGGGENPAPQGANLSPGGANAAPRGANAALPGGENFALGGANAAPIETVNESISFESVNESGGAPARDPAPREPSSEIPKPPPAKPERFDAWAVLSDMGVERKHFEAWMQARKRKRLSSPIDEVALGAFLREIGKVGLSAQDAARMCAEKGWGSIEANWDCFKQRAPQRGNTFEHQSSAEQYAQEQAERMRPQIAAMFAAKREKRDD